MHKKPYELLMPVLLLAAAGTIGLVNTLFLSKLPTDTIILLSAIYGFLHPLVALLLWSGRGPALLISRAFIIINLLFSLFLYPTLDSALLILDAIIYVYSLFFLFRHDVKAVFGED